MKVERIIIVTFCILGFTAGMISNYLVDLIFALSLPTVIYFVSFTILLKIVKKKKRWLFSNSFITFFLIWFITWVSLLNLG